MKLPLRGRNYRTPEPCLPCFLEGSASESVKSGILAVITTMKSQAEAAPSDADVVIPPEALHQLVELFGCPTHVGLDFLRLLLDWPLLSKSHSRANISACLRDMRKKLRSGPNAADFPDGHPAPVFALAYWGGLDRWNAGAPARSQRPKHFWRNRENQAAALRDTAVRFPDHSLTHATLQLAGYHALATALTAEGLGTLAAELGLSRALSKRPDGWWTAERAINAYAALCREAGVTLSNHALALSGGLACTIRVQATRGFDSFSAFQAEAARRHPDLQPPTRPVASDGTILDSWGEVVVYQAIRRAFPAVAIAAHVLLPGDGHRSCDMVLGDGEAWIEVLGMSRADMQAPRSSYQQAYAERWAIKERIYRELGLKLVVIEPAAVTDPVCLAASMSEIAVLLSVAAPAVHVQTRRAVRAKGAWTFEFLCEVVAHVAADVTAWPTHAQLVGRGYGHAIQLLKRPGVAARVSEAIGVPLARRRGEWTPDRVIAALVVWVREHGGFFPTVADLNAAGDVALASAMTRHFAGKRNTLRQDVGRRCGLDLPPRRMPNGAYATQEACADLLRPLCDRLGRFPTGAEIIRNLTEALYQEVSKRWGMRAMAAFMGVRYAPPRSRG